MAISDTYVFPGFLTPVQTQISFQSHRLLFSHASAEVRDEIPWKEISPQPGLKLKPPDHESNTLITEAVLLYVLSCACAFKSLNTHASFEKE